MYHLKYVDYQLIICCLQDNKNKLNKTKNK